MKVRSPYVEPVEVPALGGRVVNPGQVVDIDEQTLPNFVAAGWKPADDAARKAAKTLAGDDPPATDDTPAPAGQEG